MKELFIIGLAFLGILSSNAQGTFVYDQQSTNAVEGIAFLRTDQPMGQSFTPSLSAVSFVELHLYDGDIFQNLGTTVHVNLRSNSITGQILASTTPVSLPDGFFGIMAFLFPTQVTITSGATYFLEPVQSDGAEFGSVVTDGSYVGGSLFRFGNPVVARNLWFREGIIVPEPGTPLLFFGCGLAAWFVRRGKQAK